MNRQRIFVFALLSLLFLNPLSALGKKEESRNSITVYTALEDDQIPTYLKSFKSSYPDIKLNIVRDSTGIITAKLFAEKENPKADLIWGVAATSLLLLDQAGVLEPYSPVGLDRILPAFRDEKTPPSWIGIDAWMTGIIVNTEELKAKNLPVPRSYADLLKPVYKNAIVMPNPASSGTGFLTVSAFLQLMGEDKAWDYMDKLHENIAVYTHSGSQPAKMAGRGEYPVGISFGYRGVKQAAKGEPVLTVFPSEGSGWELEANALVKKDNIKPEAKTFLSWAISDAAMKNYNKNFAVISVKNDNPVPKGFPRDPQSVMIKNDFRWAASHRKAILKKWNDRYNQKSLPKN